MRHFHKCINPKCKARVGCEGYCDEWQPEYPCEDCSEMKRCEWCGAYVEKLFTYEDLDICSQKCQIEMDMNDSERRGFGP